MKKIIVVLLTLWSMLEAKEYSINVYTVTVDVNSTKANGFSWDFSGGAPDIFIKVNNRKIAFSPKCKDQYRCSIEFISEEKKFWYFEIYDKDFSNDDLIGKGECTLGKECIVGSAKIYI